ncbi:MAG: hypothetical protein ABIO70_14970 [Pseudomonadota bacterium]
MSCGTPTQSHHPPSRCALLLGLATFTACTCLPDRGPASAATPAAPAPGAPAYPAPRTAGTVGDLFCINEVANVPKLYFDRGALDGATLTRLLEDDVARAEALGVRAGRVNSGAYPFLEWQSARRDPTTLPRADQVVALLQGAGMEIIMVLSPWPGNNTGAFTAQYVPADLDGYSAWIRAVVERYDGDGQDDMPGLARPVRLWEVDNEPDMHNHLPPKGGGQRGDGARAAEAQAEQNPFETPAEYAQVLVATAQAIRAAQPDAVVFNGGTFYTANDTGRAYLAAVLAEPGAAAAVDALSVHAYFTDRTPEKYLAALDNAASLAGARPIFVTETSYPSAKEGKPWATLDRQARMVPYVYGEAMARGVERVCWHSLGDPPAEKARGGFATNSLYSAEGDIWAERHALKPAGEVYRRLTTLLGEVPLADVRRVAVPDGRAVQVGDAGWLVYDGDDVAMPFTAGTVTNLLTGEVRPLEGSVAAPVLVVPAG